MTKHVLKWLQNDLEWLKNYLQWQKKTLNDSKYNKMLKKQMQDRPSDTDQQIDGPDEGT